MWSDGVYMALEKIGEYRVVWSTRDAANLLLEKWPASGDGYQQAVDVCAEVMKGNLPPEQARQAFILAAKEAGIFVSDELPPHMIAPSPEPCAKKTDMKFRPKKRGHRKYWR
jgi:hypothetical protein